ncbi:hypothetical protein ABBQ38_011109 [Trebouxia sp. C0009 RCD-2024]
MPDLATPLYTYNELNYTSIPTQAFVGSFAGPHYTAGNAAAGCALLVSPGYGTNTFIVLPNVTYPSRACTDLAAIPFAAYSYLGNVIKCTGPGEGYQFNYPPNVYGAPSTTAPQYYCTKFRTRGNMTEQNFTNGFTADIQCPDNFSNSSQIVSDPGNNAGYATYYSLQGAVAPNC